MVPLEDLTDVMKMKMEDDKSYLNDNVMKCGQVIQVIYLVIKSTEVKVVK